MNIQNPAVNYPRHSVVGKLAPTTEQGGANDAVNYELNLLLPSDGVALEQVVQKLLAQSQISEDELVDIDGLIASSIAKLPEPVREELGQFRAGCKGYEDSLQPTPHGKSPEEVNAALHSVELHARATREYLANFNTEMSIPFSVLALQILSSSTKIMAAQANVALKKLDLMTKLIEQLQALTSLLTEITNQLNNAFNNDATEQTNNGRGGPGVDKDTKNWNDIVENGHGQTKLRKAYDLNAMFQHHWGFNGVHFKNDKLGKFLLDHGYITVLPNMIGVTIKPSDKALSDGVIVDGCIMVDKLSPDEKQEFLDAFNWTKNNDNSNYKDWAADYKICSKFADFPDFYNEKGDKVANDDPSIKDSVIFAADKIPPALRDLISPLVALYDTNGDHTGKDPSSYAFSAEALGNAFKKLVDSYVRAIGEVPEDFNQKMTGSLSGTVKDVDNLASILQQKIKYIQQKQESLTKIPENAKEDSNRKLDLLQNILRSTSF